MTDKEPKSTDERRRALREAFRDRMTWDAKRGKPAIIVTALKSDDPPVKREE